MSVRAITAFINDRHLIERIARASPAPRRHGRRDGLLGLQDISGVRFPPDRAEAGGHPTMDLTVVDVPRTSARWHCLHRRRAYPHHPQ